MVNKKVCIIGAGLGGLSAGLLLLKKGHLVTIFEKEDIIGGRALALDGNTLTLEKYRLILSKHNMAPSTIKKALNSLQEKGIIAKRNNNYLFQDTFFELWLKERV